MSEMVERVARAMAEKLSAQQFGSDVPWHDAEFRRNAIEVAEVAIMALGEPTDKMRRVGANALYPPSVDFADECWRVMIQAALSG